MHASHQPADTNIRLHFKNLQFPWADPFFSCPGVICTTHVMFLALIASLLIFVESEVIALTYSCIGI